MLPMRRLAVLAARQGTSTAWSRGITASSTLAAPFTRNLAELDAFNRQRTIVPLGISAPSVAPDAWVAANATVVGNVTLADGVSVFYGAVLRGDMNRITVGAFSNIGEKCVLHAARTVATGMSAATSVGRHVTVGAGSLLRSATVENEAILGQRCILLEGSVVETQAVLRAGTVVPPGCVIPSRQMWAGNPAQYVRDLSADELMELPKIAEAIRETAEDHADQLMPESSVHDQAAELRAQMLAARASSSSSLKEMYESSALLFESALSQDESYGGGVKVFDPAAAFKLFDRNGDGVVTEAELKSVLAEIGHLHTDEAVRAMVAKADRDGDGKIDYNDFLKLFNKAN